MPRNFQNSQNGFTGILLIVGFVVVSILLGTAFLLGKEAVVQVNKLQDKPSKIVQPTIFIPPPTPTLTPTPTPTPSPWKAYTNSKYNFELTYPKIGVIIGENGYLTGECGNFIKEETLGGEEKVLVDSFFEIKIISWQGTLDDYLKQNGALEAYNFEQILDSGADKAVEVLGLKQDVSYAVGYPPLKFVTHIFQKGNKIFLIQDFHNSEYFGGCLNPKILDPTKYDHIVNLKWDLKKSFKFF